MTCRNVSEQNLAEDYLLGTLSEDQKDAFEQHYLGCDRCFEDLQLLQSVREELSLDARTRAYLDGAKSGAPAGPSMRGWVLVGAAAASIVLVAGLVWRSRLESVVPTVAQGTVPTQSRPAPTPPAEPALPTPAADRKALIASLSRAEPPPYEDVVLRGAEPEAETLFRQAMKSYMKGNYAETIAGLERALALDSRPAEIHFYLGACLLLMDRVDPAIEHLRRVVDADSPFSAEAHLYLAKAYLRRGDLAQARRELDAVPGSLNGLDAEVQRLKEGIDYFQSPATTKAPQ